MNTASIKLTDFQPILNDWQECTEPASSSLLGNAVWITDKGSSQRRYLNQDSLDVWQKSAALVIGTPTIGLVANVVEAVFKMIKIVTFAHFWLHREVDIPSNTLSSCGCPHVFHTTIQKGRPLFLIDFFPTNGFLGSGIRFTRDHLVEKMKATWAKPLFVRVDEQHPYHFKARLLDTLDDFSFIIKLVPSLAGRTFGALFGSIFGLFSSSCARDGAKLYATFERWQGASFMLAPCFQPEATHHGLGGDIHNPKSW